MLTVYASSTVCDQTGGFFGGHWLALRSPVDKDAMDTANEVICEGCCDLLGFSFSNMLL